MLGKLKMRSPLTLRPLRHAGQSLDLLLQDLVLNRIFPWLFAATFLVALAVIEWIRFALDSKPSPWIYTVFALVVCGLAFLKIRRSVLEARRVRLGRDGERAVGEILHGLLAEGWQVFHDVPGEGFNIDHVAIGPAGVFTIETKTRSKPDGKGAKVVVERSGISVAGAPPSRDALDQALAQSAWLADLLKRSTSYTFRVRPVVLFPGWYVTRRSPKKPNDPWVLEPKAFVKWLRRERTALTDERVALASVHLSLYLRRDCGDRRESVALEHAAR
jgi:hypothetical protein